MVLKKLTLMMICGLLAVSAAQTQSNQVLDQFLAAPNADFDLTVYLVFSGAKLIPDDLPPQVAFEALKQKKWGYLSEEMRGKPVTMGDFAYLVMKSFNMQGGVMYSLLPSPWYATREFNFKRFMPSPKKANENLTPYEVVQALAAVLDTNPLPALESDQKPATEPKSE